jgi:phage-related minor tail protein
MDDEVERLVVSVRADTSAFARDVSAMRSELEGPLAQGAARAGRTIEGALSRAIVSGKFGFDDLKRVALSAMSQIATASVRALFSSSGSGGASVLPNLGGLFASLMGSPGRATGGPVAAGRSYIVGERGPELFVPSSGGRIETGARGSRDVRVSIAVQTPAASDPKVQGQSSRQLARAVRSALRRERPRTSGSRRRTRRSSRAT